MKWHSEHERKITLGSGKKGKGERKERREKRKGKKRGKNEEKQDSNPQPSALLWPHSLHSLRQQGRLYYKGTVSF